MNIYRHQKRNNKKLIIITYFVTLIIILSGTILLTNSSLNTLTIGGIPFPIVKEFLTDFKAMFAYVTGNKVGLHDRLKEIGIEEKIKDYYRSSFQSEAELDQYIHQIFYEKTGYIGKHYKVNKGGDLELKKQYKFNNNQPQNNNSQGFFEQIKPNK